MSKKVFIGVGHGGVDSGAVNGKLKEKDIVLQIALVVNEVLINHNISTKMSRERDENDTIQDEVKEEKSFRSDLAIDIHINAGGGNGFEVFHHHLGGRSKTLAQNIEREVMAIGQNSRGCKTKLNSSGTADYYMFIRETVGSAVIVECAFIDTEDIKCVDEPHEQRAFGIAIAKGALKTLGITYKGDSIDSSNNNNSNSNTGSNGFFRVVVGSFKSKDNAIVRQNELSRCGVDNSFLAYEEGFYRVIVGSYRERSNAEIMLKKTRKLGFDSFLIFKS